MSSEDNFYITTDSDVQEKKNPPKPLSWTVTCSCPHEEDKCPLTVSLKTKPKVMFGGIKVRLSDHKALNCEARWWKHHTVEKCEQDLPVLQLHLKTKAGC